MTVTSIPADAISFVCSFVRDHSAIELESSKSYLIEARLTPLAKKHGFASPTDFIQDIRSKRQPDLERRLVEAMTTHETSFYRDIHPFDALRTVLLPKLQTQNAVSRSLNIWSAACSTGQEVYSIAMLLHEHFPALLNWNLKLVATDLSQDVLDRAKQAQFTQIEVNRGMPAPFLLKYFRRDGMHWRLAPELVSMVTFTRLNLIESWPTLPKFDVVFLRNVLIYFAPDVKKQILRRVRETMTPTGVLFLGAAETTMGLDSSFVREQVGNSVFYRVQ